MFSFLSRVLASASHRFFAFELGRQDYDKLNKVFNITLLLFLFIIGLIFVLGEAVGVWFIQNKMNIPPDRIYASHWVFQFSVISFAVTLLAIPYQAVIIAREKMDAYAFIGILEAILRLGFVLLLQYTGASLDKLIVYSALMMFTHIITNLCYIIYSKQKYVETKYKFYWDKSLAKEITAYSGWNLFGAISSIIRSQGINILINMFFNPVVNAARGLAYQVNNALNQFAASFYTAVRPQVTKFYAKGDREATLNLVFSSSKYTYYLLLFFAVTVIVYAPEILSVWLVEVPEDTVLFVRLVILVTSIDAICNPLDTLAQATGKVRLYQSVVGTIIILNLPISWMFLHLGFGAEYTMYVAIGVALFSLFARLFILRHLTSFPILNFINNVLVKIFITSIIAMLLNTAIKELLFKDGFSIAILGCFIVFSIVISFLVIAYIGLSKNERQVAFDVILKKLKK